MAAPEVPDNPRLRPGSLSVARPAVSGAEGSFETFIKITADGSVTAFNGHVDLGTGIQTALGQIVAEELEVSFARVVVVLGDTSHVPNQGATIASETIQITAVPLRKAAAQARHFLIDDDDIIHVGVSVDPGEGFGPIFRRSDFITRTGKDIAHRMRDRRLIVDGEDLYGSPAHVVK